MKVSSFIALTFTATLAYAESGLRDFAKDINIGFAINSTFWEADQKYSEVAENNFNLAVGENACKLSGIQAEQGVYDFTDCDRHVNKAKELNLGFRGHCLVWHGFQPRWFMNLKGDDLRNVIVDHITTTLTHYRGKIDTWDIVNEAIDDSSTGNGWTMRNTFLYKEVPDFVDVAFKTAREVDPEVKLFYNDYNNEGTPFNVNKTLSVYNFVKDMVERGVPIDGVGIQFHVGTKDYPTYEAVMEVMAKYAELGLEVQITEMDVVCNNGNTPEEFEKQAEVFGIALRACLDSPNCTAFLIWGLADHFSWRIGAYPTIFDDNLLPKPAYYTLLDILKEHNDKIEAQNSDEEELDVAVTDVIDADDSSDEEQQ